MTVTTWTEATAAGDVTVIEVTFPRIRVQLLSLGAAICEVDVPDRDGNLGGVHLALPTVADHAVIPLPCLRVDRLADRAQQPQALA